MHTKFLAKMHSRRNLRIKVMQALYAHQQNPSRDFLSLRKSLQQSIGETDKLFLFNIYFLIRVAEFSIDDLQVQSEKHESTADEKNVSTLIYKNAWVQKLTGDEYYRGFVEKQKPHLKTDEDLVRKFYLELKKSEEYRKFVAENSADDKNLSKIFQFLYGEMIYQSETFDSWMEDLYPIWADEHTFVHKQVDTALKTGEIGLDDKEDDAVKFSFQLLEKTFDCENELMELIKPKLKNWDADRLAAIDLILIKMALSEILYFENIPVKVSINEYIDISKLYSTPKSKDFVNGMVDKIKNELMRDGKIQKSGRGLVND